jgi:hypothetical protein
VAIALTRLLHNDLVSYGTDGKGECFRDRLHDAAPGSGWTAVPLELPGFTEPR